MCNFTPGWDFGDGLRAAHVWRTLCVHTAATATIGLLAITLASAFVLAVAYDKEAAADALSLSRRLSASIASLGLWPMINAVHLLAANTAYWLCVQRLCLLTKSSWQHAPSRPSKAKQNRHASNLILLITGLSLLYGARAQPGSNPGRHNHQGHRGDDSQPRQPKTSYHGPFRIALTEARSVHSASTATPSASQSSPGSKPPPSSAPPPPPPPPPDGPPPPPPPDSGLGPEYQFVSNYNRLLASTATLPESLLRNAYLIDTGTQITLVCSLDNLTDETLLGNPLAWASAAQGGQQVATHRGTLTVSLRTRHGLLHKVRIPGVYYAESARLNALSTLDLHNAGVSFHLDMDNQAACRVTYLVEGIPESTNVVWIETLPFLPTSNLSRAAPLMGTEVNTLSYVNAMLV